MEKLRKEKLKKQNKESLKKSIVKIIAVLVIVSLNWTGLSAVLETLAYYNDTESSPENSFSAGILDFRLTNQNVSGFVGMENNGEIFHTSVAIPESGSMPMQYFVYSASVSPMCSEFRVRVKQNEAEIFNGPLPDFLSAATTVFGTWKFEFDLPVGASVTQGDLCQANITFSAWREEIENLEESGFFDIETLSLDLKAKTIVLNEVLAYPNPSHPYPANREFIELKNNGNAPADVAGWKVSEISGASEKKYTITTSGGSNSAVPYGGSTIIPAGEWLVLLLSGTTALNNDGDTIRLYDSSDNKLDEYSYEIAKYGLSDARYLDGVGAWVDPIPTPGGPNVLTQNDLPEISIPEISIIGTVTPSDQEIIVEEPSIIIDGLFVVAPLNPIQTEEPVQEEPEIEPQTENQESGIIEEEIVEKDIIVSLQSIDIIETTTPALEEVIVIEEEPIIEEEPAEELEEEIVVEEEKLVIKEPEPEPELELDNIEEDDEE